MPKGFAIRTRKTVAPNPEQATRAEHPAWGLTRDQLDDAMAQLAESPDKAFSQGNTGLCGKMSLLHAVYSRSPDLFQARLEKTLRSPHSKTPKDLRKKLVSRTAKRKVGNPLTLAVAADVSSQCTALLGGYHAHDFASSPIDAIKGSTRKGITRRIMRRDFGLQQVETLETSTHEHIRDFVQAYNDRFDYRTTVANAAVNGHKFEYSDETDFQKVLREEWTAYMKYGGHNMTVAKEHWSDGHRLAAVATAFKSIPAFLREAPVMKTAALSGHPHAVSLRSRIRPATDDQGEPRLRNGQTLHEFVGYNSATGKTRLYRQTLQELKATFRSITVGDVPLSDPTAPYDATKTESELFATYTKAYESRA